VIAVCSAPGKGGHAARRLGPDGITLTQRGKGTNTRFINNIAMEAEDYCRQPAGDRGLYPRRQLVELSQPSP
jgi:5-deoxy-D-glucuronate isomerase